MPGEFDGTIVLVTGATGGLGTAIAEAFAREGAELVLHHRSNGQAAAELAGALATEHGTTAHAVRADLADEADLRRMFADGSPAARATILVNNAGRYPVADFHSLTADDWVEDFRLNVVAAYLCTTHAARAMAAHGGGAVVNITSISADRAVPEQAAYAAGKAALRSLTRTSAVALAPRGIRVNAVAPGLVHRASLERDWPDGLARWSQRAPSGRPVDPREVANACVYLCSSRAAGITGQELAVDGGITAVSDY
ncbi:SDR family NAD(P)-dependent oxidoreductase [Agromyces tropicus]|uniref:SDR family NAD(P)-dependent oxidoreductase n=1 Tax=Agromyces tropicus TaxID=555371 RepID=A0ABP5FIU7_9MICO